MNDFNVTPVLVQVFGDKPAVTVVGCFFTAKEAAFSDGVLRNMRLDLARFHKFQEITFVIKPSAAFLLVSVEQILGRRKQRDVHVIRSADFAQKELKVVLLCETRQLRHVIEAHIHDTLCAGVTELREELLCRFLGESYGEDSHADAFSLICSLS